MVYSFGIVSGYGGTPVNIETIAVAGATPLRSLPNGYFPGTYSLSTSAHYFIDSFNAYDPVYRRNARGGVTPSGKGLVIWTQRVMTSIAYKYLVDTYIEDSTNRNLVTINTCLYVQGTYTEHDAIFSLSPFSELTREYYSSNVTILRDVVWTFRLQT